MPVSLSLAAQSQAREILELKTETEKEYTWNDTVLLWQLTGVSDYVYTAYGDLMTLTKYDAISGDSLHRIDYSYTPDSRIASYTTSLWTDNGWSPDSRYAYLYSSYGKTSQRILRWDGSQWVARSLDTLFQYDQSGRLTQSENFRIKSGIPVPDHTVRYEYGSNGKMSLKYSLTPEGNYISEVAYNYDNYDRMAEMVARFYRNGVWEYEWRREYYYDRCGVLKKMIRQWWLDNGWKDLIMSDFEHTVLWNNPTNGHVAVCLDGKSLIVSLRALETYLRMGACIGECAESESSFPVPENPERSKENKGNALLLFPNPASESFVVRLQEECGTIGRVDIYNVNGNIEKSVEGNGLNELTINREETRPGRYLVVIRGEQDYVTTIIFK